MAIFFHRWGDLGLTLEHGDVSMVIFQYLIAFGKPVSHREVAPRELDVHSRWKPAREAEERRRRRRRRRKKKRKKKKKGRRRQNRKTEAACVASAGCSNLLIVYQISTAPSKVAPGTMYEPLA